MSGDESLDRKFAKAAGFYEKGKFGKAKKIFANIQKSQPDIPEVLHMLALIALKTDRAEEAAGHLENAVKAAPGSAALFGLLGGALNKAGRASDAVNAFEQAITLEPGQAETHYNLANALRDLGRGRDAALSYRRAIELDPGFADALNNLGRVLTDMGEFDGAVDAFLGAAAVSPNDAWIHTNLGNAYREMGNAEDAIEAHRRAVGLDPEGVEYRSNLAAALVEIGKAGDGAEEFRRALKTSPGDAGLHCGLGNALVSLGRIEDAKAAYAQALEAEPENPMAHYLLGRALLLDGDLGRGWREFGWRWKVSSLNMRSLDLLPQPPWQGQDTGGKTILVWGEQGVGDEVLFAGMIPDLMDQGATVVLECDPRLFPLYERSFGGVRCIAKNEPPAAEARSPDIDFQVPSGNLGRWLRPGRDAFPGRPSYLSPDKDRRDMLRGRYLGGGADLLAGIAWNSNAVKIGRHKSLPLSALRPLTDVPGVTFVDLQYGDTGPERKAFTEATGTHVIHDESIDQMADLDAFAAQVAAMDLVISVSNTTVHIAGAMGVPTWVLLNAVPLSFWMLEGDRSPWYPSVRLFRQAEAGEWVGVIEGAAAELASFARD